MKTIFFMCDT